MDISKEFAEIERLLHLTVAANMRTAANGPSLGEVISVSNMASVADVKKAAILVGMGLEQFQPKPKHASMILDAQKKILSIKNMLSNENAAD